MDLYTYDEALESSLEYFGGDELAAKVFVDKYALQDNDGNYLEKTPEDMHWRLAKEFYRIEKKKFAKDGEITCLEEFTDKNFGKPLSKGFIFSLLDKSKYLCIAKDNWILTSDGPKQVVDLINKSFIAVINNKCYRTTSQGFIKTGQKQIFKIKTKEGYSLRVTEEHPICIHNKLDWYLKKQHTSFVSTKNLKIGDKIVLSNNRGNQWDGEGNFDEGWLIGQLVGDGTFGTKNTALVYYYRKNTRDFDIALNIFNKTLYEDDNKIQGYRYKSADNTGQIASTRLYKLAHKFGITKNDKFDISVIEKIASSQFCFGFICGLFDADGHIYNAVEGSKGKDMSIRLSSSYDRLLYSVQRMLARIGIVSTVYLNRKPACVKKIQGVTAHCKAGHELRISKNNIYTYCQNIGSMLDDKKRKLDILSKRRFYGEKFFCTVSEIVPDGKEDVYDCSIEHVNTFDCNGMVVHNCPQGSILYGVGNKHKYVSISNCFVVDSTIDSYAGIIRTDEHIVHISKRRGGLGWDISNLRPKGLRVQNAAQTTTGATSFMHRFSSTGREISQFGRRAAELISMSVHHPDIIDFATIKNDDISVTGANISIKLTDKFMEAVKKNTTYIQQWPLDTDVPEIYKEVKARDVWNVIIHSAWLRAEPGLLFWDNIIRESPADCYAKYGYKSISVNPCAELVLSAYDSCRLLAINLFNFVKDAYTNKATFDYNKFYKYSELAERLMDDIVDLELECIDRILNKIKKDPEPDHIKQTELSLWKDIKDACINGRRTGTGITALGDTLAALGIKYSSKQSIETTEQIYKTLKLGCYRASVNLAKEFGAFSCWDYELEKNNPFLLRIKEDDSKLYNDMKKYGRRNIALLTTAPTGSISTQACLEVNNIKKYGTTAGIEPLFKESFTRRKKGNPGDKNFRSDFVDKLGDHWQHFEIYHPGVDQWKTINKDKNIDKNPYHGACANDINWTNKLKLQAGAQRHIDHAISNTVNLPNDVEEKEIAKIYMAAYNAGCKGVTIYREGSRTGVLVNNTKDEAPERPKEIPCDVYHITAKGKLYMVFVGILDDKPHEIFACTNGISDVKVKTGVIEKMFRPAHYRAKLSDGVMISPIMATATDEEEAVTRLVSLGLQNGTNLDEIVSQLEKIKGEMTSFAKAIARALKKYVPDGTVTSEKCPECNLPLVRQEGCKSCVTCGFSKCG